MRRSRSLFILLTWLFAASGGMLATHLSGAEGEAPLCAAASVCHAHHAEDRAPADPVQPHDRDECGTCFAIAAAAQSTLSAPIAVVAGASPRVDRAVHVVVTSLGVCKYSSAAPRGPPHSVR